MAPTASIQRQQEILRIFNENLYIAMAIIGDLDDNGVSKDLKLLAPKSFTIIGSGFTILQTGDTQGSITFTTPVDTVVAYDEFAIADPTLTGSVSYHQFLKTIAYIQLWTIDKTKILPIMYAAMNALSGPDNASAVNTVTVIGNITNAIKAFDGAIATCQTLLDNSQN